MARFELQGRGLASGIDAELSITSVSQVEHRKIARQHWYLGHSAALDATGLPE